MLTAKLDELFITHADLWSIHKDERITKHELVLEDGAVLYIANNGHSPITEQYQMFAKGIVYEVDGSNITPVSIPYVKFYNSFEEVALRDIETLGEYSSTEVVKKQDGTLISRFCWKGEIYFATRGNILVRGKQFYNPVMKVALLNNTHMLYPTGYWDSVGGVTALMEYVGPSNVILEKYETDELIGTGVVYFSWDHIENAWSVRNGHIDEDTFPSSWGLKITPVYNLSDPKEVLASLEGIQEGVIVNYLDTSGYYIVYRVKFKHEEYIKALKARSAVAKIDPYVMLFDHMGNVEDALAALEVELAENPFREELVHSVSELLCSNEVQDRMTSMIYEMGKVKDFVEESRVYAERAERKDVYTSIKNSPFGYLSSSIMRMTYGEWDGIKILREIHRITG